MLEAPKIFGETDNVNVQLSLDPLFTSWGVIINCPLAPNENVLFLAIATGLIVSTTVTVAVAVETLPLTSVTVKVTVLAPVLAQVKEVLLNAYVAIPQLSVDPLLIWAGVIVAVPFAPNCTVIFCVNTVGLIVSCTVTVAFAVATFPLISVTVKVTVLAPTLAQVNEELLNESVAIPQLSVEPLSIWAGVIVAWPFAFNWTVMLRVITVGFTTSSIVTLNVSVTLAPSWSAMVNVIVVEPNWPVTGVNVILLVAPEPEIVIWSLGTKAVFEELAVTVKSATGVVSSLTVIETACVVWLKQLLKSSTLVVVGDTLNTLVKQLSKILTAWVLIAPPVAAVKPK